jgi:hypothetical protein
MIRLFQHRGDRARSELDELLKVLGCLKSSDAHVRFAVGAGVSLANAKFISQFAGMESFRRMSPEAQGSFYATLSDLELNLRHHGPGMALGVGLYRIWLADVLAGRRPAADLLGEELTELSRKASGTRPTVGRH